MGLNMAIGRPLRAALLVTCISVSAAFHGSLVGLQQHAVKGVFESPAIRNRQACPRTCLRSGGSAEDGLRTPPARPKSPEPPKPLAEKSSVTTGGKGGGNFAKSGMGPKKAKSGGRGKAPSTVSDFNNEISRLGKAGRWQV